MIPIEIIPNGVEALTFFKSKPTEKKYDLIFKLET